MSIDEAIAEFKERAKDSKKISELGMKSYIPKRKEEEQIVEWLEELKSYRENSNGYAKEDIELNRKTMYNKAIDDFVKALRIEYSPVSDEMQNEYDNVCLRFEKIAEQLKVGGKNELLQSEQLQKI